MNTRRFAKPCRKRWRRAAGHRPDAGGPRDLVTPWRTGLLLPVDEFEARLGTAVAHLIDQRPRYSHAARRSVLHRSWPAICDELLGHYAAVLQSRREAAA
ncbi:GDP-mannose-dependent alpha-mannosyltransferase domain protein [Mycobacterium xenopi 4042]|uniref:GDP-mannose-dependent alpha-mannosyltransferase domain protein n=1 Tax=Mycobacterium xenopi 4042 TaxID=1299334 RepID=X8CAM4_MYCXE|nr:GDP-mannose-dependent alpha-mannosyltransferase domain protein [Mycobacterium xenopi 4042]